MKKLFAFIFTLSMTSSMFAVPANAFYVDYVTYSLDFSTYEERVEILHIESEDGSTENFYVYDEDGNQLYIQTGENEWEKIDTPISAEEAERLTSEKNATEQAAQKAAYLKKEAELENAYRIDIAETFAEHPNQLEELEYQIKLLPNALYRKVDAQLSKMGRKISIADMAVDNFSHIEAGYGGLYVPEKTQIEIAHLYIQNVFPHEYGHLIFTTVLPQLYSSAAVQKEWNALSGGEGPSHVSEYATTSYQEDLAETFDALVTGASAGCGEIKELAMRYPDCLAIKKIDYMRDLLCKVLTLDKSIFPEFTQSVPSTLAKAETEEYQNILDSSEVADTTEPVVSSPAFSDASVTAYYAEPVKWAVENGVTAGTTATTFSPNNTCTNAHILTFMWRAAGSPEPTVSNPVTNINGNEYYAKAAMWAYEKGMISGTAFEANKACTRAMTMEYFWKQAGSPETEISNKFTDVVGDASYAQAVAWAVDNGVTAGVTDNTFVPDQTCTRGQIVTFLYRALVK